MDATLDVYLQDPMGTGELRAVQVTITPQGIAIAPVRCHDDRANPPAEVFIEQVNGTLRVVMWVSDNTGGRDPDHIVEIPVSGWKPGWKSVEKDGTAPRKTGR